MRDHVSQHAEMTVDHGQSTSGDLDALIHYASRAAGYLVLGGVLTAGFAAILFL